MLDGETDKQSIDESASAGSSHRASDGAGPLAELSRLSEELRTLGARIFSDLCALAHTQWRLSRYVLAGSANILLLRALALLIIAALVLVSWIFLNMAVWQTTADFSSIGSAPPLALFLLNLVAAFGLYRWQKGLILK